MKIIIETIPHDQQRYNTCGDWQWVWEGGEETLRIKVSKMKLEPGSQSPAYMEFAIGIHEAVEAMLCRMSGVTEEMVDKFDNAPDVIDRCGKLAIEPGDDRDAPYRQQHCLATGIERILCFALGIAWDDYETQLAVMSEEYRGKDKPIDG